MVGFGIVLLIVGVGGGAALAWLLLQHNDLLTLTIPGYQIGVLPITIFVSGAVSMLLLWLGVRVTRHGLRRRRARRAEMRELRHSAERAEREPTRPATPGPMAAPPGPVAAPPAPGKDAAPRTGALDVDERSRGGEGTVR